MSTLSADQMMSIPITKATTPPVVQPDPPDGKTGFCDGPINQQGRPAEGILPPLAEA
jgi:hypothetical protein